MEWWLVLSRTQPPGDEHSMLRSKAIVSTSWSHMCALLSERSGFCAIPGRGVHSLQYSREDKFSVAKELKAVESDNSDIESVRPVCVVVVWHSSAMRLVE